MRPPVTLAVFAAGLAVVFGAATAVGAAVGPVGPAAPAPAEHAPAPDGAPAHDQ